MKRFILLLLTCLFSGYLSAAPVNKIVVFGDSLSDKGNLWEFMKHKLPPSPPYFEGHFSNGPIWAEYLTNSYFSSEPDKHLVDYAFGGAGIVKEEEDDGILFTLNMEIESYLVTHGDKAEEDNLYVVWIGANNYLTQVEDPEANFALVRGGIKKGITKLIEKGAKHILVIGLPDLGKSPFAREMAVEKELTYFCARHNQELKSLTEELGSQFPAVQILNFDVSHYVDKLLASPEKYGFTNTKDTCVNLIDGKSFDSNNLLKLSAMLEARSDTNNCEGYLFFDPVHPTTQAHILVAEQIKKLLQANGL